MTDNASGAIVNEHYLNKVLDLSEEMGVTATEDVYDTNGMKLLAKGSSVSRRLQERLIVHRLRKPIESCIAVEGGVDGPGLAACAARAAEQTPALAALLGAAGVSASDIRRELSALRFGPAMTMMLTMIDRGSATALRHVAEVAMLALAFGARAGLAPGEQRTACMAGVLHDIGELYIDPGLLDPKRVLTPEEWAHVIIHPHIGRLLIQDLEDLPPGVGQAVAEHHERLNGTGYPRAMVVGQSSAAGQLVAGAELISSLLHKPNALQRADLAVKIVSGEQPRLLASIVSQAARELRPQTFEIDSATIDNDEIDKLSGRMAAASELMAQLARDATLAPKHLDLMLRSRERLAVVQRAFVATGLDMHLAVLDGGAPEPAAEQLEVFESEIALREINWRIRDIGRDLAIQLGAARGAINQGEQLLALLCA